MWNKIVVIGSGNVARNLVPALGAIKGVEKLQVVSRNPEHAERIAEVASYVSTGSLDDIWPDADLYVMAVSDNAISEIVESFASKGIGKGAVWLHTSGGVVMNVLSKLTKHHGVFYPLQTFSKERHISLENVPIFIEGSSSESRALVKQLAEAISRKVYFANSIARARLHLAAVFAGNFVNHMLTISDDLLNEQGFDMSVLEPLIKETVDKAFAISPVKSQTGPARRNDTNVMERHMQLLSNPLRKELYNLISVSIIKTHEQN